MTVFVGRGSNVDYKPLDVHKYFEELTEEQKEKIRSLNRTLRELESKIKQEVIDLTKVFQARAEDPNDSLEDFEVEVSISFYRSEDDPEYDEYEGNCIVELFEGFCAGTDWEFGIGDQQNHTCCGSVSDEENHCMLMHSLHLHCDPHVGWLDILRIGRIYTDIKIDYQYMETKI